MKLTFSIFEQHFKKPGLMALWVEEILWLTSVINPVQWAGDRGTIKYISSRMQNVVMDL